ncbi:MAG TPA: hypothetical protein VNE42_06450 [Acidimicrobiales bacterium]|nr:hypothetical protein [Acidimicrobiales bacterium]
MERRTKPRWFNLRVVFAVVVVALLCFDLLVRRYWFVSLVQVVLVVGIIVTSVLDLRDMGHRHRS